MNRNFVVTDDVSTRTKPPAGWDADTLAFINARIVLPDEVVSGSVRVEAEKISAIDGNAHATASRVVDLEGDFLLPGFIDVHTDNLEKHLVTRPGVFWDPVAAVLAHDALVVAGGITTVFDSLCVGALGKPERKTTLPMMMEGLRAAQAEHLLRADHLLHLRCDVTLPTIMSEVEVYLEDPRLIFATFLEDSVARDLERFRLTMRTRGATIEEELNRLERESIAISPESLSERRRALVEAFSQHGIACANHDDTNLGHVEEARALGMTISEFPVTEEAAAAAQDHGMTVIAGAPNVVLGRSHNGFLSIRERASKGAVQILCSDYIPSSLLRAVFVLANEQGGLSLPRAVSLVTKTPAETFGLTDRGSIEIGRRADLIRVSLRESGPVLRSAWVAGQRVF